MLKLFSPSLVLYPGGQHQQIPLIFSSDNHLLVNNDKFVNIIRQNV